MQTNRILILGKSGSGKTHYAKRLIERYKGRYNRLVILNRKPDLAQYAEASYKVSTDNADPLYALNRHRRVMFRVVAMDFKSFLDRLGHAMLEIGERERARWLFVADEGHNFFDQHSLSAGMTRVVVEGREAGINTIVISQQLRSNFGAIHRVVLRQATHLVTFRLTEKNEVAAFSELCPEVGARITQLRRPTPEDPGAPEFAVKSLDTERTGLVLRHPKNPQKQQFYLVSS